MSNDKKLEYIKLIHMLSETFGENDNQSPEEIRQEFRNEGIDIDLAESQLMNFRNEISMAAKRQELDEARIKREMLNARKREIMENFKTWTREQVLDRLKEVLKMEPNAVIAYRDLQIKEDEDIKAILVDIELAKLTEKESNENGSE